MDHRDIEANTARFVTALERGDAAGMAACYAPDGVLLPPGYPSVAGREAIQAFWDGGIAAGLRSVKLDTTTLEITGDAAVETGRATVLLEPPGGTAATDVGKYVVVHKRLPDGGWRWAIDIFNFDSATVEETTS